MYINGHTIHGGTKPNPSPSIIPTRNPTFPIPIPFHTLIQAQYYLSN